MQQAKQKGRCRGNEQCRQEQRYGLSLQRILELLLE
jgi:hypothetical protein